MPVAALLGLLAAALVAACGSPPPSAPAIASPPTGLVTPAPATIPPATEVPSAPPASTSAGAPPCTGADLKASHGLVEGAAGSQLTEVVLVAAVACSVDAFPTLGLRDASGAGVVGGVAGGAGRIDLAPNAAYASVVRIANWCAPEPAFPVTLEIRLGTEEVPVTGGSFPEEGSLPPCNGAGAPILEGGAWARTQ